MKDSENLRIGRLNGIFGLKEKIALSIFRGTESYFRRFFTITLPAFPVMLWIIMFVFIPMGIMGVYSFWTYSDFDMLPIWTIENYLEFFTEWMYLKVTLQTILIATVTTVFCVALGYPVSYYLARRAGRWRNFLIIMIMIPFWTSFLIRTYVWMTILGEQGIINYV